MPYNQGVFECCPNCPDRKLRKHGKRLSDYHDIFTDHKLTQRENHLLCSIKNELYHPKNHDLYQLVLNALSLDNENKSAFYTNEQVIRGGGIFTKVFNNTLTRATYGEAGNSLLKKMEDNLYQLVLAHPYYLGSALLNGQADSFLYHLLGMFHAMISLALDPLVELTALVTRTVFASKPDKASDLFPPASIPADCSLTSSTS